MKEVAEESVNLSKILNASHEDKWVAIAPDYSRVIAAAPTLREIMGVVSDSDAIFHRVFPRGTGFVAFLS